MIPKTGPQTIIISAIGALHRAGGDSAAAQEEIQRRFSFLDTGQAERYVSLAQESLSLGEQANFTNPALEATDFAAVPVAETTGGIVDGLLSWRDENGATQYRTVYVQWKSTDTIGDIQARLLESAEDVIEGGADSDSHTAPQGEQTAIAVTIVALI